MGIGAEAALNSHAATAVEDAHIKQALEASQTAIDAIGAISSIASIALTVLGIGVAIIALWGFVSITRAAKATASKIANSRVEAYIKTEEFDRLVREKIELSIKERWSSSVVASRIVEESSADDEAQPFPPGVK